MRDNLASDFKFYCDNVIADGNKRTQSSVEEEARPVVTWFMGQEVRPGSLARKDGNRAIPSLSGGAFGRFSASFYLYNQVLMMAYSSRIFCIS